MLLLLAALLTGCSDYSVAGLLPKLALRPEGVDLAPALGEVSSTEFQVSNVGDGTLIVESLDAGAPFSIEDLGFSLESGAVRSLTLSLATDVAGSFSDALVVLSNDPERPLASIPLSALLLAPQIHVQPDAIELVATGELQATTIEIFNLGEGELILDEIEVIGDEGGVFSAFSPEEDHLAGGGATELVLTCTAADVASAVLQIPSNDPAAPVVEVALVASPPLTATILDPLDGTIHELDEGLAPLGLVGWAFGSPEEVSVLWSMDGGAQSDIGTAGADGLSSFAPTLTGGWHELTLTAKAEGWVAEDQVQFYMAGPPTVTITSPVDGSWQQSSGTITFEGRVSDPDEAVESLSILWESDVDGSLDATPPDAAGNLSFERSDLSPGWHEISLSVTDGYEHRVLETIRVELVDCEDGACKAVQVAAGDEHAMAITADGGLWTWGHNDGGMLGLGTTTNGLSPARVPGLPEIVTGTGGWNHAYAVDVDGTIWSWGANSAGQLGDGTTTKSTSPGHLSAPTDVVAVAAGDRFGLALTSDGTVYSTGDNSYGQLGDGTRTSRSTFEAVSGLPVITAISAEEQLSAALDEDGVVWVWGENGYGQLGPGPGGYSMVPLEMEDLPVIVAIAVGEDHMAALDEDGVVWTWGCNTYGQLGDGTKTTRSEPAAVSLPAPVVELATADHWVMALDEDGVAWVWGLNNYGQLGDNTNTNRSTPQNVVDLPTMSHMICGYRFGLAIDPDGVVWAWGDNEWGQLGDGTGVDRFSAGLVDLLVE